MASTLHSATPAPEPGQAPVPLARIDRLCYAAGLIGLLGASWAYLIYEDWAMRHMDLVDMAMPSASPWSLADVFLVFVMWAVMMVAMMLPSVLPLLLIYRRLVFTRQAMVSPAVLTGVLVAGYLSMWTMFSVLATLMQWALHTPALLSAGMITTNRFVAGTLLILAGVYQWTPFKSACLAGCRSPLRFLFTQWREGMGGAWRMGLVHGAYCIGCCWMLMVLLFVYGVMNVAWIAAIATYVLIEKLLPPNRWLTRISGLALIVWGLVTALG